LKLKGTNLFLVCADDKIMGESVHTMKKNTETVVVARKGIGPEVNSEKNKYVVMSRDQNAGQNHNIKMD
jgi:hypothetical protein